MANRLTIKRTEIGLLVVAEVPATPGASLPFFERIHSGTEAELRFRIVFARRRLPDKPAPASTETCELHLTGSYHPPQKLRIYLPNGNQKLVDLPK
jgi:hypothetical protein